ncbi:Short-chain dehydrogenase/reductase tropE [Lachnellula suecica]|uniref:Short-chain dehydrogenase/reductase tropE n=1 Tax=Lachnellula suecica TaxID=602035 RepID=A0A8T9CJ54_9HELO|nr:Short-chain dehydrogenase/reductase tropE [Lachnellula suecica]
MDSNKTVVLITGANGGIGYETALLLATSATSFHVIVGARSAEKGEKAVSDIKSQSPKGTLSHVQLDVTDSNSIKNAVSTVEKDFGRIDVLINNAGIISHATALIDQLRETFETNTFGPAIVTEAFTPLLLKSKSPKLIYVSSNLGSITWRSDPTNPYYALPAPAYRMSKAALNMLLACDYATLGSKGVKAWAYCPGYVVTNLSGTGEKGRQERVERGAGSAVDSAKGILAIWREKGCGCWKVCL